MPTMNKYLISIVGATAIGKTSLSIHLAQHFNAPIISSDSRQFYKEMCIGTAVPTSDELSSATHHFIQNRSIHEDYSVGQFEKDVLQKLEHLFVDNTQVIMVGGSGLYVDAVLKGLDYFPDVDLSIRTQLNERLTKNGLADLQNELKQVDIDSYTTITLDNPQRVIRALEVSLGSKHPYSYYKNKEKTPRNFIPIKIGLNAVRSVLYDRINKRVDLMLSEGLLKEAKKLYPFKHLNALQTVGYKELFEYFEGNCTLETAIEEIKKNTRRFAKRQGTWFRKDDEIKWFDFNSDYKKITQYIENKILGS